jgi:hypothetical protein
MSALMSGLPLYYCDTGAQPQMEARLKAAGFLVEKDGEKLTIRNQRAVLSLLVGPESVLFVYHSKFFSTKASQTLADEVIRVLSDSPPLLFMVNPTSQPKHGEPESGNQ